MIFPANLSPLCQSGSQVCVKENSETVWLPDEIYKEKQQRTNRTEVNYRCLKTFTFEYIRPHCGLSVKKERKKETPTTDYKAFRANINSINSHCNCHWECRPTVSNSLLSANVTECVLNEPPRLQAVSRDDSWQLLYSITFQYNDFDHVLLPVKYSVSSPQLGYGGHILYEYGHAIYCAAHHVTSSCLWRLHSFFGFSILGPTHPLLIRLTTASKMLTTLNFNPQLNWKFRNLIQNTR